MLSRYLIVPDREATLEALFWLGKTNLHREERRKSADANETPLEIACYPGTDNRLREEFHVVIFRVQGAHPAEQEVERVYPNRDAAVAVCRHNRLAQCDATVHTVDYIRDTKTGEMLYSSYAVLEHQLDRRSAKR